MPLLLCRRCCCAAAAAPLLQAAAAGRCCFCTAAAAPLLPLLLRPLCGCCTAAAAASLLRRCCLLLLAAAAATPPPPPLLLRICSRTSECARYYVAAASLLLHAAVWYFVRPGRSLVPFMVDMGERGGKSETAAISSESEEEKNVLAAGLIVHSVWLFAVAANDRRGPDRPQRLRRLPARHRRRRRRQVRRGNPEESAKREGGTSQVTRRNQSSDKKELGARRGATATTGRRRCSACDELLAPASCVLFMQVAGTFVKELRAKGLRRRGLAFTNEYSTGNQICGEARQTALMLAAACPVRHQRNPAEDTPRCR